MEARILGPFGIRWWDHHKEDRDVVSLGQR